MVSGTVVARLSHDLSESWPKWIKQSLVVNPVRDSPRHGRKMPSETFICNSSYSAINCLSCLEGERLRVSESAQNHAQLNGSRLAG